MPGVRSRPAARSARRRAGAACGAVAPLRRRRRAVAVPAGAAGGAQPALRVEQEHARGDDPLAFREPGADLDAIGQLHAERDGARLEPIARRDEHVLLHVRCRRRRHAAR